MNLKQTMHDTTMDHWVNVLLISRIKMEEGLPSGHLTEGKIWSNEIQRMRMLLEIISYMQFQSCFGHVWYIYYYDVVLGSCFRRTPRFHRELSLAY